MPSRAPLTQSPSGRRPVNRSLVTFMLSAAVVAASAILTLTTAKDPTYFAPELTILGTLAAFVIALCFRQLSSISKVAGKHNRRLLTAALVMAAATLLADARMVAGVAPHMFTRTLRQWTGHSNR